MDIQSFDSVEEIFDAEVRAQKRANENPDDWQKSLHKGDYFVKDSGPGCPIFGRVLREYKQKGMANYRFCECYSVACPYGERGDVHVSTIGKKIDENVFTRFKQNGWSPE